jgi:hypothetical protein
MGLSRKWKYKFIYMARRLELPFVWLLKLSTEDGMYEMLHEQSRHAEKQLPSCYDGPSKYYAAAY